MSDFYLMTRAAYTKLSVPLAKAALRAGLTPDIVTMAKGIGNGCPLAAVITTPEIAQVLASRIHFNTFGGNPVVTAIGKAVLEVIERENLQENSLKMGARIRGLKDIAPLGRLGTESETAAAIVFLLSDGAAYISGSTLRVDGAAVAQHEAAE